MTAGPMGSSFRAKAAKLPVGIDFLGLPFSEPTLLRIGAAYEAATHHRTPPPDFGPLDERDEPVSKPKPGQPGDLPPARTLRADERYSVGEN